MLIEPELHPGPSDAQCTSRGNRKPIATAANSAANVARNGFRNDARPRMILSVGFAVHRSCVFARDWLLPWHGSNKSYTQRRRWKKAA